MKTVTYEFIKERIKSRDSGFGIAAVSYRIVFFCDGIEGGVQQIVPLEHLRSHRGDIETAIRRDLFADMGVALSKISEGIPLDA